MHPNHIYFPVLPGPPTTTHKTKEEETEEKKRKLPSPLGIEMLKLPAARILKKNESFPTPTLPEAINYAEIHFSICITILRDFFGGGGEVGTEDSSLSFSTVSLWSLIPPQKKFPCPLYSVAAWIIDLHMVSGYSTSHGHQHGFSWQHGS